MENGIYFFFEDKDAQSRQSIGGFYVHNIKYGEGVFLYCAEYDQFWRGIDNDYLVNEIDFKRPALSPVSFEELISSEFCTYIHGVAKIANGKVDPVIRFK